MFSVRFAREVIVTNHARVRMQQRNIGDLLLLRVIDEGSLRYRDGAHLWAWLDAPGRADNLICAALLVDVAVVIKTVMHHWELLP